MSEEPKLNFYRKNESPKKEKIQTYVRIGLYVLVLIFIIVYFLKFNTPSNKALENLDNKKVKAEIYAKGSYYNNYYYGVRNHRPSADWDIEKIQDVYPDSVEATTLEERIKPIARFISKDGNKIVASATINVVILNEPRTSISLLEERYNEIKEKYGTSQIKALQEPISHISHRGKLKAAYAVVEINDKENPMTFVELFIVKNKKAFNLHCESSLVRYDIYKWDFEHYINNLILYK